MLPGLLFICGRSRVSPAKRDRGPCFLPAVRLAACSARIAKLLSGDGQYRKAPGLRHPEVQSRQIRRQEGRSPKHRQESRGCPLGCVFCQNREIALGRRKVPQKNIGSRDETIGVPVTVEQLAETFLDLERQHANNINLVTPTHFVPQIIRSVRIARERGLTVPIVYNTGSYETEETVRSLKGTVDIFLPDLKFMDPDISDRYAKAPDYFEVAERAIRAMVEIAGQPAFDERGMMKRGVIVRHMVLPGHTKDSKRIVSYLHETYGEKIYVSIMNQYTPMPGIGDGFPELARRVTKREYGRVVDYAIELGMENVFIQEGPTAAESFIPEFDGTGLII